MRKAFASVCVSLSPSANRSRGSGFGTVHTSLSVYDHLMRKHLKLEIPSSNDGTPETASRIV
jgi:hypothetical protein